MKKRFNNIDSLNNVFAKHLKTDRNLNNLMYKTYIYNLFQFNEKKYKKIDKHKFKAIIKSSDTRDTPNITNKNLKKHNILYTHTNENNKNAYMNSTDLKKINHNLCLCNIDKNHFKSRNYKKPMKNNYSYSNKVLTVSGINNINNTIMNSSDKYLVLGPISKQKVKNIIVNSHREIKNKENNNQLNIDINNKKRFMSTSHQKKLKITNKNNNIVNNSRNRNNSSFKKNKIKVKLFREINNDMSPRNRFNMLKKFLLEEDKKINKMFMNFQTQISKNQILLKRFTMLKKINKGI